MLTSKDIIERTGISRATLNNYISSGLVPRPQVLPPHPQDGGAPRIGYFPDDTLERIGTIQRLKQEGWSITRIARHFAGPSAALAGANLTPTPLPTGLRAPALAAPEPAATTLHLAPATLREAAYLVDGRLRLVWLNDAARQSPVSPLAGRAVAADAPLLAQLLAQDDAAAAEALLRLHLDALRTRLADPASLLRELAPQQLSGWEDRLRELLQPRAGDAPTLVRQLHLPAAGALPGRLVQAVQFAEGVLFTYQAAAGEAASPSAAPPEPLLTPVVVLVTSLHDAAGLWVRLSAPEYFELLNEVAAELDRIFREHRGRPGAGAGEVLACYFLPEPDTSYLWNALAAARQTREAMRQLSRRWRARKSWDVELLLNIGIEGGEEWMGVVGAAGQREARVLGDAAERAEVLARSGRVGAILVTRSLVGKLPARDRQRLKYGVHRGDGDAPLLFTFARLAEIASAPVPARVAELAVAEVLELTLPPPPPAGPAA